MKTVFSKLVVAQLAALVLASFALTPVADAQRDRGGGGGGAAGARGGGGGGAQAARGGGGGAQPQARAGGAQQVNNTKADVRTNDVRNTSANSVNSSRNNVNVNNTNVNVNRNVNVNASGGCCNNGWDNDYHPVAGAMAVGAAVAVTSAVIGSMVAAPPPGCVPVNYGGMVYQQCGSAWYQPQGTQFVVVNAPY